jgi:hypothetical protein
MMLGRSVAILAGVIAAAYLSWFILTNNVVETLMEDIDTGGDEVVLSDPLVAAGTVAFLFYPALHARLLPIRERVRLVARIVWIVYVLIFLLAILGVLGPLVIATEPRRPNTTTIVAIGFSAVALVAGAISIRAAFGNLPVKQTVASSGIASLTSCPPSTN